MSRGLSESLQAPPRPSRRSFACQSLPQLQCCCSSRVYRYSWSVSFISGKRLRRSFGSVGTPAHVGIRLGSASESGTTQAPPIGARFRASALQFTWLEGSARSTGTAPSAIWHVEFVDSGPLHQSYGIATSGRSFHEPFTDLTSARTSAGSQGAAADHQALVAAADLRLIFIRA